jgi:hypothetical protein
VQFNWVLLEKLQDTDYKRQYGEHNLHIYRITNNVNGKVYIGQTELAPLDRWKQHIYASKNPKMLISKAINKHGADNFTFDVIAESDDQTTIDNLEMSTIKEMDTRNTKRGYNVSAGGKSCFPVHVVEATKCRDAHQHMMATTAMEMVGLGMIPDPEYQDFEVGKDRFGNITAVPIYSKNVYRRSRASFRAREFEDYAKGEGFFANCDY